MWSTGADINETSEDTLDVEGSVINRLMMELLGGLMLGEPYSDDDDDHEGDPSSTTWKLCETPRGLCGFAQPHRDALVAAPDEYQLILRRATGARGKP